MQIAISLLISAMHLLNLVQANPTLPQSFKDNATNIANTAIVYAQNEINKSTNAVTKPLVSGFVVVPETKINQLALTDETHGVIVSNIKNPDIKFVDYNVEVTLSLDNTFINSEGYYRYNFTLSDSLLNLSGTREGQSSDGPKFAYFKAVVNGITSREELQRELSPSVNIRFK